MATRIDAVGDKYIEVQAVSSLVRITVVHCGTRSFPEMRMVLCFEPSDIKVLESAIRLYGEVAAKAEEV